MADVLRIALDFTGIQSADDGDTTRYGGTYTVDGQTLRGYGDDRSDCWIWDVVEMIGSRAEAAGVDLEYDAILDAVESIEAGTIVVSDDGSISVEG